MTPTQAWIRRCPDLDGDTTNEDTADADTLYDAGLIFFDREPQAFNFQHREPDTANVSHKPWPPSLRPLLTYCGFALALTFLGLLLIAF